MSHINVIHNMKCSAMQQSQIFNRKKCMLPDWGGRREEGVGGGSGPGFPGYAYEEDEFITLALGGIGH